MDDHEVTRLLEEAAAGDASAMDRLMPLVYDELRAAARRVGPGRAFQPTTLVHDAYIKLARREGPWDGRRHFLCVAAKAMRQILLDRARELRTEKRGGALRQVTVDETLPGEREEAGSSALDLVELDAALSELADADARSAAVVEMRYLSGMTIEEVAASLGVSETTVKDDWRAARAWLRRRLGA